MRAFGKVHIRSHPSSSDGTLITDDSFDVITHTISAAPDGNCVEVEPEDEEGTTPYDKERMTIGR